MPAPASAARHYRRLQRLKITTILGTRRLWSTMRVGADWERQYEQDIGPRLLALTLAAQAAAVREADRYVAEILRELEIDPARPTAVPGPIDLRTLVGVAGDGRPVETLLSSTVGRARAIESRLRDRDLAAGDGAVTVRQPSTLQMQTKALEDSQTFLDTVTATLLADANRAAETVAFAQRPWVDGWVRMINPPCCSRCALLAGRFYRFSEGFERHPLCDCYHAPAPSDPDRLAELLEVNSPARYFESLTEAEQDRAFTAAGAEAIRNGADIAQVVNARRGMQAAQLHGRTILATTEGTVGRGRRRRGPVRLMPESILQAAGDDRDEQIRLLKLYGYIT